MHRVHKIITSAEGIYIKLAQEEPSKPLKPGETPKRHLPHYKLHSKDIQQSSSDSTGEVGGAENGSDENICPDHSRNVSVRNIRTVDAYLIIAGFNFNSFAYLHTYVFMVFYGMGILIAVVVYTVEHLYMFIL